MIRPITAMGIFTLLWLAATCLAAAAAEAPTDRPTKPAPVVVAAKVISASSKSGRHLEIWLNIADGARIISQHDHEFLLPLQITLLDAQRRPIKSNIEYPKPKTVVFEKELGGDYQVYIGNQTFIAKFPVDQTPKYVNVLYSGYTHSY